jgi:hypothetical protein
MALTETNLLTFLHYGFEGDAFADNERVRLLPGFVVLFPVVPLADDLRLGHRHPVLSHSMKLLEKSIIS